MSEWIELTGYSDNQLIFPSFVFCYNPSKYPNVILLFYILL